MAPPGRRARRSWHAGRAAHRLRGAYDLAGCSGRRGRPSRRGPTEPAAPPPPPKPLPPYVLAAQSRKRVPFWRSRARRSPDLGVHLHGGHEPVKAQPTGALAAGSGVQHVLGLPREWWRGRHGLQAQRGRGFEDVRTRRPGKFVFNGSPGGVGRTRPESPGGSGSVARWPVAR